MRHSMALYRGHMAKRPGKDVRAVEQNLRLSHEIIGGHERIH